MSFWGSVGDLLAKGAKSAASYASEKSEEIKKYKEEMTYKSDSELIKIVYEDYKASRILRSGAARGELKNRGYSDEEINSKIKSAPYFRK